MNFCQSLSLELDVDVDVFGDVDVVVVGADIGVEDIEEEESGLDDCSILVLDNEGRFCGGFEAVGATVEAGTRETDPRDPSEDFGDSAVGCGSSIFSWLTILV